MPVLCAPASWECFWAATSDRACLPHTGYIPAPRQAAHEAVRKAGATGGHFLCMLLLRTTTTTNYNYYYILFFVRAGQPVLRLYSSQDWPLLGWRLGDGPCSAAPLQADLLLSCWANQQLSRATVPCSAPPHANLASKQRHDAVRPCTTDSVSALSPSSWRSVNFAQPPCLAAHWHVNA